jgi:hypothetical protein
MDEPVAAPAASEEPVEPQYLADCDPGDETVEASEPHLAA